MAESGNREEFKWNDMLMSKPSDSYPEQLYLELSSRCNFSCRGCFRESFRDSIGDMSDELLAVLLENLSDQRATGGVKKVFLGGIGEPLLHPRFKWLLSRLSEMGIIVELQTNGSLLDREMISFLIDMGLDRLVLSYETGSLGHAAGALSDGCLGDAFPWNLISEITELKSRKQKRRPFTALEWVLSRDSLADLKQFGLFAAESGVDEIIISNLLPVDEEAEASILYRTDGCRAGEQELLEPLLEKIRHRVHYTLPWFSLRTERYCSFIGKKSAVIRWDGNVAPCYRLLHDGIERVDGKEMALNSYFFGNINERPLFDIWNSREYIWFRLSVTHNLYPSCTDCSLKDGCEYLRDSGDNCWAMSPSCGNCLWSRQIILCP